MCFPLQAHLTFFGIQHPVTGQTCVCVFFPFGSRASPPLTCRYMCALRGALATELGRREKGLPSLSRQHYKSPLSEDLGDSRNQNPLSNTSSLYVTAAAVLASFVDDGLHRILQVELELMDIAGRIFKLTGIFEKLRKRAWPFQTLEMLGLDFESLSGK